MSQNAILFWQEKQKLWESTISQMKEYKKVEDMTPFAVEVDTSILLAEEEAPYAHHDHNKGTIVKRTLVNIIESRGCIIELTNLLGH